MGTFDVAIVGNAGIDTNVYLNSDAINSKVDMKFAPHTVIDL
jgi:hypothetical protein